MHRTLRIAITTAAVLLGFLPSLAVHEGVHCFVGLTEDPSFGCRITKPADERFLHADDICGQTFTIYQDKATGRTMSSRSFTPTDNSTIIIGSDTVECPLPLWLEESVAYLLQGVVLFAFGHYAFLMSAGRRLEAPSDDSEE